MKLITALIVFFLTQLNAQQYSVKLVSPIQTSDRTFQFDVVINSTGQGITAYQCALSFNPLIGDSLSFTYVNSSCQLLTRPLTNTVKIYDENINGSMVKKICFGSNADYDYIESPQRIGTFLITSKKPFNAVLPDIKWCMDSTHNLRTIICGEFLKDVTSTGEFVNLNYNIPLPVQEQDFSVKLIGDSVKISWLTITETNSYGFYVLRNDLQIRFIPGAGNSNSPKYYCIYDKPSSNGEHIYKLKMMDMDGSSSYSDEVKINYILNTTNDEEAFNWIWFGVIAVVAILTTIFTHMFKSK